MIPGLTGASRRSCWFVAGLVVVAASPSVVDVGVLGPLSRLLPGIAAGSWIGAASALWLLSRNSPL